MFGYSLVYIALVQEPDYEVSGSSTGVVTQGIMRGVGEWRATLWLVWEVLWEAVGLVWG